MLAQQRRQRILEILQHEGGVRVSDLSRDLAVSEMTIRRDLSALEHMGRLARTHGGAVQVDITSEPAFAEKADLLAWEKLRIAKAAASLVEEGVVGLSAGTTTTAVAACLPREGNLTVVTNAVNIAWSLAATNINVVMTGGSLRNNSYALVGPGSQGFLNDLWLDILFLGANGVSLQGGITTPNLAEAETNSRLVSRAKSVVVVADHSKLGRTAFGHIADLAQVDLLITNREADGEFIKEAQKLGLTVQLV